MTDPSITVVQVLTAPMHPMDDICDVHAGANLYGLGKGCYPKGKARLQAVLNGERLDDVLNAGVDEAYRLKRLATLAPMKPHPQALPNTQNAVVPIEKVAGYALNPYHAVGGNKSNVFASAFGFTQQNAQLLVDQILENVAAVQATERPASEYGQTFSVDVPVSRPAW